MLRWGYFYQQCVRGTGTYKVLRSPMFQSQLCSGKKKKQAYHPPRYPNLCTSFFTPILPKRGSDGGCFWWLLSPPLTYFCTFWSIFLFFPQLCSLIWSFQDLNLCSPPEASFNKVPMIQAYFGWGHLCLLGLIITKSSRPLTPPCVLLPTLTGFPLLMSSWNLEDSSLAKDLPLG